MSGLPIVAYAPGRYSVRRLVRQRWRKIELLVAGAMFAAILIGAIYVLDFDMLVMPLIEHYNWSGWHQVVYLGIYAVGARSRLWHGGRGVRNCARLVCAAVSGSPAARCNFTTELRPMNHLRNTGR